MRLPTARAAVPNHILILLVLALSSIAFGQTGFAAEQGSVSSRVEKLVSSKGVQAWLAKDHHVPLVAINFAFVGGTSQDAPDRHGATMALAQVLNEGTAALDEKAFRERLSELALEISFNASTDSITCSLVVLTKRLDEAAALLRQVLTRPRLEATTLERIKRNIASGGAHKARAPQTIAYQNFYAHSFPGHAYGRNAEGTPESMQALTVDHLADQHRNQLVRSGLKVVLVGDIGQDRASALLDRIFGDLPPKGNVKPTSPASRQILRKHLPAAGRNAAAVFSVSAPPLGDPDFFAALVLNQIVGSGGFEARLTQEVRVKRGLTYAIETRIVADKTTSFVLGNVSTQPENITAALDVTLDVLTGLSTTGRTEAELTRAKNSLVGTYLLDLDTNARLAGNLLGLWLDGLAPEYHQQRSTGIARVTAADVRRVAARYFTRDTWSYVAVGGVRACDQSSGGPAAAC